MRKIRGLFAASSITALALGSIVVRANEAQTFAYDAQGRLIAVSSLGTINSGQKHTLCYDRAGNRMKYKSDAGGSFATCPPLPPLPTPTPTPT
jgi:hypothetical protein